MLRINYDQLPLRRGYSDCETIAIADSHHLDGSAPAPGSVQPGDCFARSVYSASQSLALSGNLNHKCSLAPLIRPSIGLQVDGAGMDN